MISPLSILIRCYASKLYSDSPIWSPGVLIGHSRVNITVVPVAPDVYMIHSAAIATVRVTLGHIMKRGPVLSPGPSSSNLSRSAQLPMSGLFNRSADGSGKQI